jgi:hypothetical protein
MNDILHEALDNIGGSIRTLHILPFDEAPNFTLLDNVVNSNLNLASWSNIDFTFDTLSFIESEVKVSGTEAYKKTIAGSIPRDRAEISKQLRLYNKKRVVVVHTDRNGTRRVIGSRSNPAVLSFNFGTGPKPDDQNKYDLVISQTDLEPAPYYSYE